jgi:hypothetical protein
VSLLAIAVYQSNEDVDWYYGIASRLTPTVLYASRFAAAVEELLGVVACHLPAVELAQRRLFSAAALGRIRAALVESTA